MYRFDAEKFQMYREQVGLTQAALAMKIYVSRKTIANWEQDYTAPSGELLMECARIFQVRPESLMKEIIPEGMKVRKDVGC